MNPSSCKWIPSIYSAGLQRPVLHPLRKQERALRHIRHSDNQARSTARRTYLRVTSNSRAKSAVKRKGVLRIRLRQRKAPACFDTKYFPAPDLAFQSAKLSVPRRRDWPFGAQPEKCRTRRKRPCRTRNPCRQSSRLGSAHLKDSTVPA